MSADTNRPDIKQVHVPSCRAEECNRHMRHLVESLEKQNVRCVWEFRGDYGYGGLYTERFQQFFTECCCTVIHICPQTITKAKQVIQILEDNPDKTYFIRIQSSPTADPDFLLHFILSDVCSKDEVQKFVKVVVHQAGGDSTLPIPQLRTRDQPGNDVVSEDNGGDVISSAFQPLVPVLRSRNVSRPLVEKSQLTFSATAETADVLTDVERLAQKHCIEKDLPHLCHVVLPDLCKKKDIVSLAHLSSSQNQRLRVQALYVISQLLCEHGLHGFPPKLLQNVEEVLFKAIEQEKYESLDSGVKFMEDFGCTELLVIVYLMVCVMCMMTCDHSKGKCHVHLVSRRPLFRMSTSIPNLPRLIKGKTSSAGYPPWVKVLNVCFTQWRHKTCACISRQISTMLAGDGTGANEKLAPELHIPLLIASLVQSYKDIAPSKFLSVLHLLDKQKRERTSTDSTQRELKRIMVSTAVFGLTVFLQHRTGDLTSSDNFEGVCHETVECLEKKFKMLETQSKQQCLYRMTSLLFHSGKAVRLHTAHLFRLHSFYHQNLWDLLLLETVCVLWPLLTFSKWTENDIEVRQNWCAFPSTFADRKVLAHVHKPPATNHLMQNNIHDRGTQQDRYFQELACLKELQHARVVELMAYHEHCCPQFYITEDYLTKSLQMVLVNKSKNNDRFSVCKLLQMLVEGLEGIQFCHEHNIIHRDLTAASLFISASGQVKLANFKQARKLAGKNNVREFQCSFIPTRWSAPESHRLCIFSIASDMWMVGHLMYEVLTHGRMPYADIVKSDEELMPMVVKGEKTLCYEPCIPTGVRTINQQLTSVKEEDRALQAREVASKLQMEISKASDVGHEHSCFPNLSAPGQAATEHKKGLVLSLVEDYKGPTLEGSSDIGCDSPEVDESGYSNFGPHKGLRHFREPCPVDFTSEEWSVLTQESLPGITQIIGRPEKNKNGQLELPFAIPAETLCSLKDAVLTRWLGNEINPYIVCLHQLANIISQLHARGIILCDFAADTIHIEKFPSIPDKYKLWVTSLPNIKLLPVKGSRLECNVQLDRPQCADKKRRAAGEVLQYGQYSTASDVYCYSVLVWWVFNAFDVTRREQKVQSDMLYPLEKIPENEVYENVNLAYHRPLLSKPASCPAHIYHRMKECWQSERHERPYMPMLEAYMTLCEPEVAPESIGRESGTFMGVENFSEPSDMDSLSSYADIDDDIGDDTRVANPSRSVSKISEGEESAYDHLPEKSDIDSREKIYDDAACGGVNTQAHYINSSEIHRMQSKEQVFFGEFDEFYITRDGEPENSKQNVTPSPPKQKPPVAPKPRMTLAGPQQVIVGRDGTSAHLPPPPSPAALSLYMVPGRGVTAKDGTRLQLPPPPPPSSGENDASGKDDCYLPLSGHTPSETTTVNDQDLVLSTKEHSRDDVCLNTPPPLPPRTHMHKLSQTTNETAGRAGMAGRSTRGTADRLLKLPTRPPPPPPPPPQSLQPPTVQQNSTDPPPLPPRPNLRCPSLRSASPAVYHNNNLVGAAGNRESAEFPVYEDLQ